jgi:hypothetical protein
MGTRWVDESALTAFDRKLRNITETLSIALFHSNARGEVTLTSLMEGENEPICI